MKDSELEKLIETLDSDTICDYCKYEDGCPRGVACYGGDPSYPYCTDNDINTYFDHESYLEDHEEEVEE